MISTVISHCFPRKNWYVLGPHSMINFATTAKLKQKIETFLVTGSVICGQLMELDIEKVINIFVSNIGAVVILNLKIELSYKLVYWELARIK